ncbi:MAG: hypothetical protein ACLFPM_04360 [Candidatus Izemoplasmatales bacterium]
MFQERDISVGAWFVFFLISAIPLVNIIFWIILLVSPDTNQSLKNLLVLHLILAAVGILFFILFWGSIVAQMGAF